MNKITISIFSFTFTSSLLLLGCSDLRPKDAEGVENIPQVDMNCLVNENAANTEDCQSNSPAVESSL